MSVFENKQFLLFFSHIIVLIILSLFSFNRFDGRLFAGLDGPAFVSINEIQNKIYEKSFQLHIDPTEGLGSTINDFNLANKPSFSQENNGKIYEPQFFYTWFAIQLFITVLLIGWNYRFSRNECYAAAWLLTIFLLPYFQNLRIYSLTEATPSFLEFIFVFALMDIGIQRMGTIDWKNTVKYGCIFFLGILYGLIFCPSVFVIILPILILTTIHAFVKCRYFGEYYRKLIMVLGIFLICLMMGWMHYVSGLILNTAANFFHEQMTGFYHSRIYISILFIGQLAGSTLGPYFFCSATLGILLAIYYSIILRSIALTVLIAQLLILGCGAIAMSFPKPWLGPSFIYFEMILFPFYSLFTVYLFGFFFKKISDKLPLIKWLLPQYYYFVLIIFIFMLPLIQSPNHNRGTSYALPAKDTQITKILEREIGLNVNEKFKGRVANILLNQDWLKQCSYFFQMNHLTGNDHQSSGLWFKYIPTLHEYHQQINPGFYSLYHRFLSNPNELFYRNWTHFSKIDLNILKLLGVRFVITTESVIEKAKSRAKITFGNNVLPLYLHEIPDANIAGISATKVLVAKSISNAEDLMSDPNFNFKHAIVISDTDIKNIKFGPANRSIVSLEKGGFHVRAESTGTTLLVLPFEYSHCLKPKIVSGAKPRVIRVDAILTGIMFEKKVDIILDNSIGPFTRPRCRLKDYFEFKHLWQSI